MFKDFNQIMEPSADIRERGITGGTGFRASSWTRMEESYNSYRNYYNRINNPPKSASQRRIESYRDKDGNCLSKSTYAITPKVMKYLYPNWNPKPKAYYTCLRLGIPFDPNVRAEWHFTRGRDESEVREIFDIEEIDESDGLVVTDPEAAACSNPEANLREFIPMERETWVLDAEYLEKSYLMSGNPNPKSLAWNIDPYESAWASVGLILNDEAFKHVSLLSLTIYIRLFRHSQNF